jgi:hypothetical protein
MHENKNQVERGAKDMGGHLSFYYPISLFARKTIIRIATVSKDFFIDYCIGALDSFYWPPFYRFCCSFVLVQKKIVKCDGVGEEKHRFSRHMACRIRAICHLF